MSNEYHYELMKEVLVGLASIMATLTPDGERYNSVKKAIEFIESLDRANGQLIAISNRGVNSRNKLFAKLQGKEKEIEFLEVALDFYATSKNFKCDIDVANHKIIPVEKTDLGEGTDYQDMGNTARQALIDLANYRKGNVT